MRALLLRLAVAAVRAWTRAYTLGLPPSIRERRRAEVESDLWECHADAAAVLPLQILGRLLLGIVDDVWWRVEEVSLRPRGARPVLVATGLAMLAVMCVWTAIVLRPFENPQPPAPPAVSWSHKDVKAPPAPPPPPPPCNPPGIGRQPFSPCTPN
jgi:hypothetical protein